MTKRERQLRDYLAEQQADDADPPREQPEDWDEDEQGTDLDAGDESGPETNLSGMDL